MPGGTDDGRTARQPVGVAWRIHAFNNVLSRFSYSSTSSYSRESDRVVEGNTYKEVSQKSALVLAQVSTVETRNPNTTVIHAAFGCFGA